ncbi:leucine-rich repeat-containing protein 43 isoform X2 [Tachysurus fulvidraco]|uniref:leucine-rich repeat-containing protein 43 isoform X2 n=1 Tax=Tachysurus fulvidraco TaxID=1234273 RepID=UPI000F4F95B0|nr:leucine-rich repeat-containing protein 43 isoform X2 [Tachysurus fulvidraco]
MSLMDCRTLTSAIDKLIHGLCLESFPCGRVSWSMLRGSEVWHDDECTGAQIEEPDTLHDLLRCPLSLWHKEASWSPQALVLRELAVKSPEKLNTKLIRSSFTSLRIVDKGVSVIDEGLLMFSFLEELILTVNNITKVPSKNLPKTLKVLELYGNRISTLKSLVTDLPPYLLHLGLGNNFLGSPEDLQCFTADLWPQLISLDLSWSGYTKQYALVDALSRLPRLRSLVLEGNPLTLTTLYPGFTLDSLVHLLYLDGNQVTPDDRHRFSGLAQLKASVSEEAEVTVCVKKMKGVPNFTLLSDGSAVEFPLVSYSYSVSYEFLDEAQFEKSIHADCQTLENTPQNLQENRSVTQSPWMSSDDQNHAFSIPVAMNWTSQQEWAEVINFNYTCVHRIRDLRALKNFILQGLWLTVEEQKVLSWPAPNAENTGIKASSNKKEKEVTIAGTKSKDKKKKKESELKLIHEQPIKQTLGSVHVKLKDLLVRKYQTEVECDFGVHHSGQAIISAVTQVKEKNMTPKEENKKDKILKPTSLNGKEKECNEIVPDVSADENNPSGMEPLTVEFSIRLDKKTSEPRQFI